MDLDDKRTILRWGFNEGLNDELICGGVDFWVVKANRFVDLRGDWFFSVD